MTTLITTYGVIPVLLTLLIGIPTIVNFISWCKATWAKREKFKQDAIQNGRKQEREEEAEENRFSSGEARIATLEDNVKLLTTMVTQQKEMIERLTRSDMLDIKSWIKVQHEKYMNQGWIDTQALDLLCQRHEIYKEEGGNSWADCLVDDLKKLPRRPSVMAVAPRNICYSPLDNQQFFEIKGDQEK